MRGLRMQNRLRHVGTNAGFLKQEIGSVYVEFSVALLLFLMVLFATIEVCSAAYTYTVLADAANEGVHFAMLHSTDETGALNTVKSYAASTFHDVSKINVSVTYPDGTTTPPNRVAVNVSYQYIPYVDFFMSNPPTMHAYAEGRTVR